MRLNPSLRRRKPLNPEERKRMRSEEPREMPETKSLQDHGRKLQQLRSASRRLEELWFAGCGGCFRLSTSLRGDSHDGTRTGQQRPKVYEVENTEEVQKDAASSWVGGMQGSCRPKVG